MSLSKVRNFGIIAHIDAGKTTVSERILFYTGFLRKLGEVHNGEATMDFMKQEQERGITIASASICCNWREHRLNLIDTPGHVDFMLEVERSLRVLDGVVAVFCAVGGVQPQSETVWNQAQKFGTPHIAFINKMDREGADFNKTIDMMDEMLGANPVRYQIPWYKDGDFLGMVDLIDMILVSYEEGSNGVKDIPEELLESAKKYRNIMLEKLSEFNDEIMELYLEGKDSEISSDLIRKVTADCVHKALFTPVFCGAAYKNMGIQPLLDAIVDYLPAPTEAGKILGYSPDDKEKSLTRQPVPSAPFSALAFKIIHDPFVGQQTFIRIYSGKIKTGDMVWNATKKKRERIGRILRIFAKDREEIEEAQAGDIVALIGMKSTTTGDTLCDQNAPIILENITVPPAVISVKAIVNSRQERDKLGNALNKLHLEDPSFSYHFDEETEEAIISGMGELHLEIILDRIRTEFKVPVEAGEPSISYRETITTEGNSNTKYAKQTGGKGHYAHCIIRIEPNPGKGFEFNEVVKGGDIPREYIPAVEKGVIDALEEGTIAKYPVVDVKATLLDGSYHPVDSSEMAFRTCGSMAFKDAFKHASPVLLEPIMKIEINSPDAYLGDIIGDLTRRRGKVSNMRRFRKGSQKVNGTVPLKEMFGYATTLRSLSSGRANFSMEFLDYERLPEAMAEEVVKMANEKK